MADSSRKPKISLRVLVDEEKNKIVLVEAGRDFVDVLFSFLKLQMGTIVRLVNKQSQKTELWAASATSTRVFSIWRLITSSLKHFVLENPGGNMIHGCISNLFHSFKDLSRERRTSSASKLTLPWYYKSQKQLLDINTEKPPDFVFGPYGSGERRLKRPYVSGKFVYGVDRVDPLNPICQHSGQPMYCSACKGFLKGNMKFRALHDLIITPLSSSSTIGYLKKFQVSLDDVDVQKISIGKAEVKKAHEHKNFSLLETH
ncbi:hypothetical protein EUTSA_v10012106mg [Eutrema salsugineum]|uniref:Uncharacterized protein n=1 Tax=Eutrema salsugineum TaxID=72664 RepID=V4JZC9_EUTSA|nr:hypothetical protein EUTSA_v10012106mg [Eutrema salsugineum]